MSGGRPPKNYCDSFLHDNDMRNHRKIKALRTKFGITGYAIWCMLLEHLTGEDGNVFEYSDVEVELLAGDFGVTVTELRDTIDFCIMLQLLFENDGFLHSQSLDERLEAVYKKRGVAKQRSQKQLRSHGKFTSNKTDGIGLTVTETPQANIIKDNRTNKDSNSSKSNLDSKNSAAAREALEIQAAAAMLRFNKDLPQDYIEAQVHELLSKYQGKEIKDIDRLAIEWIKNEKPKSKSSTKNQKEPDVIQVNGKNHKPKLNGAGWVYPTIVGKCFDESFTEVLLADGTWQELNASDSRRARSGTLEPSQIWKGKK